MSSTQILLEKIAALRLRLAEDDKAATVSAQGSAATDPVRALERQTAIGAWHNSLIDFALRPALPSPQTTATVRLTARSARLLQRGRDLLHELRRLADDPLLTNQPLDPLTRLYRDTAAILGTALRAVEAPAEAPSAQVRLCDGLEGVLALVAERIGILSAGLEHRKSQDARIQKLIELMQILVQGQSVSLHAFEPLTEELLDEARKGYPVRFFRGDPNQPARFTASHSLVVAQIVARLVQGDRDWAGRTHEPVLAGLLHDIGMMKIPAELLAKPAALNDEERRLVESHSSAGGELLRRLVPSKTWLVEAASEHHERVDGTGYPAGLRESNLPTLVRLLMVCDIYAALCTPRAYREARDTRTALTDTLLLAEQGALDRFQAERLLDLSFYPLGSVVELSDGAVGLVVAVHSAKRDLRAPARPVLSIVVDSQGRFLPIPAALDLLQHDSSSIVRTLPAEERQELLGTRYPELV